MGQPKSRFRTVSTVPDDEKLLRLTSKRRHEIRSSNKWRMSSTITEDQIGFGTCGTQIAHRRSLSKADEKSQGVSG